MTGSLQVKNGKYYMVLNSTENGKRKQKWISTGLPEKGNKRKAEQTLREKLTEEEKRNPVVCSDMTVADCVRRWLIRMRRRVDEVTYRSYQHTAETHILPYFDENRLKLCDCTVEGFRLILMRNIGTAVKMARADCPLKPCATIKVFWARH